MIRGKTLHATNLIGANAGASNFIDKNLRVLRIQAMLPHADTPEPRPGPSNPVAGDRPQVTFCISRTRIYLDVITNRNLAKRLPLGQPVSADA